MMLREQVVAAARSQLRTPYAHQGRVASTPGFMGVLDCAGLLIVAFKAVNLLPANFDFTKYPKRNNGASLRFIVEEWCDEINFDDRLPGDIAIMINDLTLPQHCGIYTDKGIIHCTNRVVEHRIDTRWRKQVEASYRPRGIDG